jgi:hypothetical protein
MYVPLGSNRATSKATLTEPQHQHHSKNQYVEAVKALDTFKGKNKAGKALVYMTRCDEGKKIDPKTVKNLRHWVQVREQRRRHTDRTHTHASICITYMLPCAVHVPSNNLICICVYINI